MTEDLQYALFAAAYEAWETGNGALVPGGHGKLLVIPDSLQQRMEETMRAQGYELRPPDVNLPKIWIEHEGRRAEVLWYVGDIDGSEGGQA